MRRKRWADPIDREQFDEFARARSSHDVPALLAIAKAQDRSDLVRVFALRRLRKSEDANLLPDFEALINDREQSVRLQALTAIARIDGSDATRVLTEALDHHDPPLVSWALKHLSDRRALSVQSAIELIDSEHFMVRWASVRALGRMRGGRAATALRDRAGQERGSLRRVALRGYLRVRLRG
ncbi:MAG: HEAT repeat domain-containing protein [Solirubrobacteraceae bacterium]|nr:HEAT repeat domain-containing protein [Solirubrobacteraceae bacterium]